MTKELTPKLINLFSFVKDINPEKVHLDFFTASDISFHFLLDSDHLSKYHSSYIKTNFSEASDCFFSIQLPEVPAPPNLPKELAPYVFAFDAHTPPKLKPDLALPPESYNSLQKTLDLFIQEKYMPWSQEVQMLQRTRNCFYDIYENIYKELQRNGDMYELLLGRVWLKGQDIDQEVNYPLLTLPVQMDLDVNCSQLKVVRGFKNPMRNDALLRNLKLVDPNYMNEQLSVNLLQDNIVQVYNSYVQRQLREKAHFRVTDGFVLFLRQKKINLSYIIDTIIAHLEKEGDAGIPLGVKQFVQPVVSSLGKSSTDESGNMAAGYDEDALLAKPANETQIHLVKLLKRSSHIIVQGPPGTGKTHTIANLMGHLLTQGKSVLVSSYTTKALSVLWNKLPASLQEYCVSVFPDKNPEHLISKTERRIAEDCNCWSDSEAKALQQQIIQKRALRKKILDKIAILRTKLCHVVLQERQAEAISIGGESVSLSKAADFLNKHPSLANCIPGTVITGESGTVLPLTSREVADLYATNGKITSEEEGILKNGLPDPNILLSPEKFQVKCQEWKDLTQRQVELKTQLQEQIFQMFTESESGTYILKKQAFQNRSLVHLCEEIRHLNTSPLCQITEIQQKLLKGLKGFLQYIQSKQDWEKDALYDYLKGDQTPWQDLEGRLQLFVDIYKEYRSLLLVCSQITAELTPAQRDLLPQLKEILEKNGKVGWLHPLLQKLQQRIMVNGHPVQTAQEALAVQITLSLRDMLCQQIMPLWTSLHMPAFSFEQPFNTLSDLFSSVVTNLQDFKTRHKEMLTLFQFINQAGDVTFLESWWKAISSKQLFWELVLAILGYQRDILELRALRTKENEILLELEAVGQILQQPVYQSLTVCRGLATAVSEKSADSYQAYFNELCRLDGKKETYHKRKVYLHRLGEVAKQWAEEIFQRKGIHGQNSLSFPLMDSWKYKQYEQLIKRAQLNDISGVQETIKNAEQELRSLTASLISDLTKLSIVHKMQRRPELLGVLKALRTHFQKLGKGTGTRVPELKNEILRLTKEAQEAIPVWVMPVGAALEQFSPVQTRFDVLILDEASQLDLKALPLLFMAKQVIIVGDDAQIAPSAIGPTVADINALLQRYHLKEYFPRICHLFGPDYSIYDFAQHSNFTPLMLTEHFRCVPDIIGFSNMLSYQQQIKPLRDDSQVLRKPAMVPFHVVPTKQGPKEVNLAEAQQIVALIYGCLQQPEYQDATFGVISLRKEFQAKYITNLLLEYLGAEMCERHRILCGLSRDFQGDERDVMFLSLVDIPKEEGGPLTLQTPEGRNDLWKKIYNVAVSRAKDQLWIIHSLTIAQDLQPQDIRRMLLEWASGNNMVQKAQLEERAESEFEKEVGLALTQRGFRLTPQMPVGGFRLDFVVSCGDKRVALECDGERYHSSEEQIQYDMQRQYVLERCGWQFERLRGSQYYANKSAAIEDLVKRLDRRGIFPQPQQTQAETDLMERIQVAAQQFSQQHFNTFKTAEQTVQ